MFHYDAGIKLTAIDLALDMQRRQPRGFISHAHADHMARHELAFCTPATARFYKHRLGERRTQLMPFGEPLEWASLQLTTFPAGHMLGAAMLLAEDQTQRLLYTGDFKLRGSRTAADAEPPRADLLIMESTFGDPKYRWPNRESVIDRLTNLIQQCFAEDVTPVIHAYALGKAQEVTRILTDAEIGVLQHPLIFELSRIYEEFGVSLGDVTPYGGAPEPGKAIIAPPRTMKCQTLEGIGRKRTFAVSGWAIDPQAKYRWQVDHAVPLSDHADYDELMELIERVQPKRIYCTHGPRSFVDHLRQLGHDAIPLEEARPL